MATEELSGEELEAVLESLSRKLERVRVLYEQFFLGSERIPPTQAQKEVVRLVYRLQRAKLKGAAQKFRFQSLMQRYSAHKAYWSRTMREIEEGRYKRQTFRAQERTSRASDDGDEKTGELTVADHLAIRMVRDTQGEDAAKRAEAERRAARRAEVDDAASDFLAKMGVQVPDSLPPRRGDATLAAEKETQRAPDSGGRAPTTIRGMSADDIAARADQLKEMRQRMKSGEEAIARRRRAAAEARTAAANAPKDVDRAIYDRFVAAKRQLNQDTSALSYDAVRSSLQKQRDKVRQKHDCARVDFDVVVKDGKAYLKPIPVKDA